MNQQDKQRCLTWVRTVISDHTEGRKSLFSDKELGESSGAFVTLHLKGQLRGCVGLLEGKGKMLSSVLSEAALSAAFGDPRFSPLTREELPQILIEISLLSPFKEVKTKETIELGKHGVLLRNGYRSALFLPQVATEQGWDLITFLSQLCRKAGLPSDAWADSDTQLQVFTAEVFSESDFF